MPLGNEIIVSSAPRGKFLEGTCSGALKPGTCVQRTSAEPVNGEHTFAVVAPTNSGWRKNIIVVLPDSMRGILATGAYASGDHGFFYEPAKGDELNMLVAAANGALVIGDALIPVTGTGELLKVTAPAADYTTGGLDTEAELIAAINALKNATQSAPFEVLATTADPSAATLVHCEFTGV